MTEAERSGTDSPEAHAAPPDTAKQRPLSAAARRALEEAEHRRSAQHAQLSVSTERGGRGGLEPARYGDWEVKGLASDF